MKKPRTPWWHPGMPWTRIDQRRFTSIWWRAGGMAWGETIELSRRRTLSNLQSQRQLGTVSHAKYPNCKERKWWLMVANLEDSPAMV
jgi:hypothetical protein